MSQLLNYIRRNNLETIIDKWGSVGLLEQLSVTQKPIVAMLYERVAIHIIDLNLTRTFGEKRTETTIFPIIYRIIKYNGRIDDVISLYNEVVQLLDENEILLSSFNRATYSRTDIEAELTAQFCDEYINRYRDPITPRKSIIPWTK
jgi:hypothetical protein